MLLLYRNIKQTRQFRCLNHTAKINLNSEIPRLKDRLDMDEKFQFREQVLINVLILLTSEDTCILFYESRNRSLIYMGNLKLIKYLVMIRLQANAF